LTPRCLGVGESSFFGLTNGDDGGDLAEELRAKALRTGIGLRGKTNLIDEGSQRLRRFSARIVAIEGLMEAGNLIPVEIRELRVFRRGKLTP
jgi:hypothetical protein